MRRKLLLLIFYKIELREFFFVFLSVLMNLLPRSSCILNWIKISPRYNLVSNSLSDSDGSLYIVSSTAITAAYRRGTRYPPVSVLITSSLRSSISTADELQLNPDFELCFLGVGWVFVSLSLFLIEYWGVLIFYWPFCSIVVRDIVIYRSSVPDHNAFIIPTFKSRELLCNFFWSVGSIILSLLILYVL